MSFCLSRKLPWFIVIGVIIFYLCFCECTSDTPNGNVKRSLIIVNTVDGSFLGIDVSSGSELWKITGPPLISQSLSNLRLVTQDSDYTIVPSLDGQLYLLARNLKENEETSLKALPLTVDSLFTSNFMLTENSVLTGGKDNSLFAFNPFSGKIKYNCSRDGCSNVSSSVEAEAALNTQEAMVLVHCANNVVRAVHIPTGVERWNLSIRQHDLCVAHNPQSISSTALQKRMPSCIPSIARQDQPGNPARGKAKSAKKRLDDPELEFSLDQLLIVARTKTPFSRFLWSYQLKSRIAKAWLYSSDNNTLEPLQLFIHDSHAGFLADNLRADQIRLSATVKEISRKQTLSDILLGWKFRHSPPAQRDPECPSRDQLVYLGQSDGNLYVQLEDSSDFPLPSRITLPRFSRAQQPNFLDPVVSDKPGSHAKSMIGYYRATYSARPADEMCMQPFLNKYAQSDSDRSDERALVPWYPRPQSADEWDKWFKPTTGDNTFSEPDLSSRSEAFSDWVYDSTRDLFILLLRATELSDRPTALPVRENFPTFLWEKFGHTIHLGMLIVILYLTHRIFRLFHPIKNPNLTALVRQSSQSNLFECNLNSAEAITVEQQSDTEVERQKEGSELELPIRQRRLSISCGTQAAPVFVSVYETEFKFVRCLGRGAFGRVFEVENRFDGHRYAIKRIKIEEASEDETRFFREVRVLASLDHPGIVRYHRAWSEYPPPGWQEARDQVLFGSMDDDTGVDVVSSLDDSLQITETGDRNNSFKVSGLSPDSESHIVQDSSGFCLDSGDLSLTNSKDFSGHYLSNDALEDSLIVFQRDPQVEQTSNEEVRSDRPTDDSFSSGHYSHRFRLDRTTSTSESVTWYLYIQMQLCSQMSLRDWLAKNNHATARPARPELYSMFWQIVDAVAYLHDHELMHRDLKPSNILFDSTNRLKLADFGLVTSFANEDIYQGSHAVPEASSDSGSFVATSEKSKNKDDSKCVRQITGANRTRSSPRKMRCKYFGIRAARRHTDDVGTDLYMSPEQERRERYDRKVDIFSLGLIFLELLIPFGTDMERICTILQAKRQHLPKAFTTNHPLEAAFIQRLLHPNPAQRPSASELVCDPLLSHANSAQFQPAQPICPVANVV